MPECSAVVSQSWPHCYGACVTNSRRQHCMHLWLLCTHILSMVGRVSPTWYTAVPTIHQAILARAAPTMTSLHAARFGSSARASAPLPLQVLAELERVFNAPVIEMYGMTEASGQITCNPSLPHGERLSSVGVAAGLGGCYYGRSGHYAVSG